MLVLLLRWLNQPKMPWTLLPRSVGHIIEGFEVLSQASLSELKSFSAPPAAVLMVMEAVMVLVVGKSGNIPKDR